MKMEKGTEIFQNVMDTVSKAKAAAETIAKDQVFELMDKVIGASKEDT